MSGHKMKSMKHVLIPTLIVVILLPLVSCSRSKTTPEGRLGDAVDLRQYLSEDVRSRAPSDDEAIQHKTDVLQVYETGSKVQIHWRSFNDSGSAYLLSFWVQVVESAKGVELRGPGRSDPVNLGSHEEVLEVLTVSIQYFKATVFRTRAGTIGVEIFADGRWEKNTPA